MSPSALARGKAPPALATALATGSHEAALAAFRRLAKMPTPAFAAWLTSALAGFGTTCPGTSVADRLTAAQNDELAMTLLFARAACGDGHARCGLAIARAALRGAPDSGAARLLLCAMLLKGGDPEAQEHLQVCLARHAEPSPGWRDLGEVLLASGSRDAAQVCFARSPPDPALAIRLGLTAREEGRLAEARAAFAEAVRLDPAAPRGWFLLGTCAQDARDFAGAAAAYRAVLDRDPSRAEAAVNLGIVLQEAGDLDGARTAYRRAVTTRADTFGRIAQALASAPRGELWLDIGALRRSLAG